MFAILSAYIVSNLKGGSQDLELANRQILPWQQEPPDLWLSLGKKLISPKAYWIVIYKDFFCLLPNFY